MDQLLLLVLAAVLGFVVIAGLGFALAGGNPAQERAVKRAQAITGAQARDARRARPAQANTPEARRKQLLKSLMEQERQQKKARLTLANRLKQAGLGITVPQFWMAGGGLGVVVMVVVVLMRANPLVALGLGAGSALGLPLWVLGFLAKRRTSKFTGAFSDAMDIIVRGIKSGLPVHD